MVNNRGKFGSRRGRPSKEDYEKLIQEQQRKDEEKRKRRWKNLSEEELERISGMSVAEIDPDCLADLESIRLSDSMDLKVWIDSFVNQAGNPYFVKICGIPTRILTEDYHHGRSD